VLWLIVAGSVQAAMPATEAAPPTQLDEVLVVGRHAGPGLWRVSKDGHDLWVLGTLEPLPKGLVWDAGSVEQRIAHSQEVLSPPQVDPHIGFFRGLVLLPSLLRARHNPDGRTLEQVLPHDLYVRWLGMRVKYLGSTSDETMRPMVAAFDLYVHALDAAGLTTDTDIWKHVETAAHRNRVAIAPVVLDVKIRNEKDYVRALTQISTESEIACLRSTMDYLQTDLPITRERANLWSLGDVARLREVPAPDEPVACFDALLNVPRFREVFDQLSRQFDTLWLARAQEALHKNASTLAVVPIKKVLAADGWLAALRARGFEVQDP
jgi:uncharacterized protein YbaP (TraB family)